jgi:phenylacetate-CoA ligase
MVIKYYQEFLLNNSKSIEELQLQQNQSLRDLICYCFDHIPYYQNLFKSLRLRKDDFISTNDLEKLPILTKSQIKEKAGSFISRKSTSNAVHGSTGGSTGVPLKYKMSPECYCRGVALLLRGWGFAGYRLGDRLAVIAGSSLMSNRETLKEKLRDLLLNFHHYSSYGTDSEMLKKYLTHMEEWQPSYLRGYASSLYMLAKHVQQRGITVRFPLKGVFSTAEVLSLGQREQIEKVFHVKVFDNYGLHDGGVSAFECGAHNGMHIDYERAILQTVDDNGKVIAGKMGKIVATSLYNFAMPFIRYDTGDLGVIDEGRCSCGNERPLLKRVYGRTTDFLKLNGKIIGSPVLTVLMGNVDVENYQIIQKDVNEIDIRYVKETVLKTKDAELIEASFHAHVGQVKINLRKVTPDALLVKNKHKFIINEVCI